MAETTPQSDIESCLTLVAQAASEEKITHPAAGNIKEWLTEAKYSAYVGGIVEHIKAEKWQQLDDVFWTVIPFGTGGRRGMMYPFGSNAINDRTIGESAQGLADYVKQAKPDGPWTMAIAYDTRHRSREFAELCAGIMVANGFEVYFIDDYRSTPELSFLIRYKNCDCGIMVTASHNPPQDNAVKVYWSSGVQLVPPHDKGVIGKVNEVNELPKIDFQKAVDDGKVHIIREEVDKALMAEHVKHSFDVPRDLKILYSPLHGVGEFNVKSLLNEVGFNDLDIYEPHREPSGDFPNVPGNSSNPENAAIFDAIIEQAQATGAELIMATDPDCDRLGAAAPLTLDPAGPWGTFNGNQLAVMLGEFVLAQRKKLDRLKPDDYVVTTLVTTQMLRRVTESFGIKCLHENLVGFKWICSVVDREGPDNFVYGAEESHGAVVGQYCRDKDGAVACMIMAELAAWVKAQGKSLHEHLAELFRKHGYHHERLVNIRMEGSDGMKKMQKLMEQFRSDPPKSLGGVEVVSIRDYATGKRIFPDGRTEDITGQQGNIVMFDLAEPGNYIAARPSGTEPKVKFYMFGYVPADQVTDVGALKKSLTERMDAYATDMQAIADSV